MGIEDRFGKSGNYSDLLKYFKLTSDDIVRTVKEIMK